MIGFVYVLFELVVDVMKWVNDLMDVDEVFEVIVVMKFDIIVGLVVWDGKGFFLFV